MVKVAINGLGRIGRAVFKNIVNHPALELVAVNDLVPADNLAYLLKYDTVYGRYEKAVENNGNSLTVDGQEHKVFGEKDPAQLPWSELGIDLVFECTGIFTKQEGLEKHIQAGAKRAILSAPAKSDGIATIVHGVSQAQDSDQVISCASCTTNCITPVAEIMSRRIGVKKATMTTIHAYTSGQGIVDSPNKNFRRGRAGAANLVPTSTGAAIATTQVLPTYQGKFDGIAVRTPVAVGSLSDLVFVTERNTTAEEVNQIFREEAQNNTYKEIIGISEDEIVSSDVIQDSRASIIDLTMTQVVDQDLVKVMSWYDNEWGYANQMIREAIRMMQ